MEKFVQPGAGEGPIRFDRPRRNAEGLGDVLDRHSAKETALYDASVSRMYFLELDECKVELDELVAVGIHGCSLIIERDRSRTCSPFCGASRTRCLDQYLSHRPRRSCIEIGASASRYALVTCEAEICFVNELGRLQSKAIVLAGQLPPGELSQLVEDARNKRIQLRKRG